MATHNVDVQHFEIGEAKISITGTVDGVQTAAVVSRDLYPKALAAQQQFLAKELAKAFENRPKAVNADTGVKVTI